MPEQGDDADPGLPGYPAQFGPLHQHLDPQFIKPGQGTPVADSAIVASLSYHVGPLPPARALEGYERAVPGTGLRIVEEAERNGAHLRLMEQQSMAIASRDALLHRLLPFGFVTLLLMASVALGIFASPWVGAGGLFGVLGTVGVAYMRGTFRTGAANDAASDKAEPDKEV